MENITRRKFISTTGVIAAGTAVGCVCGLGGCSAISKVGNTRHIQSDAYSINKDVLHIDLSKEPELDTIGGSVKVIDDQLDDGLIIVRVEENRFVAMSIYCTHRQVEVEFDSQKNLFECASFGSSRFGLDGDNLSGRAKEPLKAYEAKLENEILLVTL